MKGALRVRATISIMYPEDEALHPPLLLGCISVKTDARHLLRDTVFSDTVNPGSSLDGWQGTCHFAIMSALQMCTRVVCYAHFGICTTQIHYPRTACLHSAIRAPAGPRMKVSKRAAAPNICISRMQARNENFRALEYEFKN
jgi:hypothetical protein